MSDQEEQAGESAAPPESTDSEAVQAALKGIPGLADSVGNRPPAPTGADSMTDAPEEEEEPMSYGTPRAQVEDSEAVQQALKQLGLQ